MTNGPHIPPRSKLTRANLEKWIRQGQITVKGGAGNLYQQGNNQAIISKGLGQPPRPPRFNAIITARSGTTNATYDAELIDPPYYTVSAQAPTDRLFDTADVTYNAAEVGSPCELFRNPDDHDEIWLRAVEETITVESCDEGLAVAGWMGF